MYPHYPILKLEPLLLSPDDEKFRGILEAYKLVDLLADLEPESILLPPMELSRGFWQNLRAGVDRKEKLNVTRRRRSQSGALAGAMLVYFRRISLSEYPSRQKAFSLYTAWVKDQGGKQIGDRQLKRIWRQFEPVLHLWASLAAWYHNRRAVGLSATDFLQWLTEPENFPKFLGLAQYFLDFGSSTVPAHGRQPLISLERAWSIDIGEPLPTPASGEELFYPLNPREMQALRARPPRS